MGNEVNEVINNICNKLGYAATEITPEMAKYMIARDAFICIMATLICAINVLVAVKMIKKIQKDKVEYQCPDNTLECFVCGACVFLVILAGIILLDAGENLVGWIASPKASMVEYISKLIK